VCSAKFIFLPLPEPLSKLNRAPQIVDVLSRHICDCLRPDWEQRWTDWKSQRNPDIALYLCEGHARELLLIR
jgi:hypothetical protein